MPMIRVTCSHSINAEEQKKIQARLVEDINIIPGKGKWLMTDFLYSPSLYFQGSGESVAFVEVMLFGSLTAEQSELLTQRTTATITETLPIPASRIYIMYIHTMHWGWNGHNFKPNK